MSTEIKNIFKESTLFFAAGVALLITSVIVCYCLIPQINLLKRNLHQYSAINNLISSESGFTKIVDKIKKKNETIQNKLYKISGVQAENSHELSAFLETLINCANASNIQFVKIDPLPESQDKDFTLSPIVLDFTSTYNSLGKFVSSVEKIPQMYKINRLFVEAKSESKIAVKMMITCYIPIQERL
jgi:Tfp pilus assembly protein PilO